MRIIQKRPITGVGAGAWEVDIPLYQTEGSQLETDYYVHNEILQLLAEYGLVGWLFLLGSAGLPERGGLAHSAQPQPRRPGRSAVARADAAQPADVPDRQQRRLPVAAGVNRVPCSRWPWAFWPRLTRAWAFGVGMVRHAAALEAGVFPGQGAVALMVCPGADGLHFAKGCRVRGQDRQGGQAGAGRLAVRRHFQPAL